LNQLNSLKTLKHRFEHPPPSGAKRSTLIKRTSFRYKHCYYLHMEPEETSELTTESKGSVWNTITPLSKYLAMAVFIILPFIGGFVGYTYAPEKVVEVEKIIEVEATNNEPVVKDEMLQVSASTTSVRSVLWGNWSVDAEEEWVMGTGTI